MVRTLLDVGVHPIKLREVSPIIGFELSHSKRKRRNRSLLMGRGRGRTPGAIICYVLEVDYE
jgi:hypothetical protein